MSHSGKDNVSRSTKSTHVSSDRTAVNKGPPGAHEHEDILRNSEKCGPADRGGSDRDVCQPSSAHGQDGKVKSGSGSALVALSVGMLS